jgi:5'-3' exonuclease
MTDFVKLYAEDKNKAKASYYLKKLKFDITKADGEAERQRMLKKYLEGL